jgi:hypothetical protein
MHFRKQAIFQRCIPSAPFIASNESSSSGPSLPGSEECVHLPGSHDKYFNIVALVKFKGKGEQN